MRSLGLKSLALALAALLAGCSGPYSSPTVSAKTAGAPLDVRVEIAAFHPIPEVITVTGELLAQELATVSAKVAGRLGDVRVDLGSVVEKGDTIAAIEPVEYEYRVRQAEALVEQSRARLGLKAGAGDDVNPNQTAAVRQAAAALEESRLHFSRVSQLFKAGVLSRSDFDRGQASLQQAEAQHQAALEGILETQAQLSQRRTEAAMARYQLVETVIRAPFRGAVTRRIATLGEYVAVNSPVAVVARLDPVRLRLEVPERSASKVRMGQVVDVQVSGGLRSGKVVRLSPSIDAQNRVLIVEAEIHNADGVLHPGAFADGVITVDASARGISVPASAVISFAGVDRVYAVESGVLAERIVRVGRKLAGGRVEIASGLKAGERVVVQASDRLLPGQQVAPAGS